MTKELSLLPALYVVPTPLGNLGDLSARSLEVLRKASWIAAEDTRHSGLLLKHFGCGGRFLAAHRHNEQAAAERIIEKLAVGEAVALISDAGTPGISDPGARVVAAVRAAGYAVVPLPGPCAAITALSAAGLSDERFLFVGFLPSKAAQRRQAISDLADVRAALIFYEAPHRVAETIADLAQALGERTLVIARELTKLFEQIQVGPLDQGCNWLAADRDHGRGEFVLIVSGAPERDHEGEAERVLSQLLAEGLPVKQAVRLAAAIAGGSKNALYARALTLRQGD